MKRTLTAMTLLFSMILCLPMQADLIKQSSTYTRTVLVLDSSDHLTGKTGLTLTITESKAGGAFAAITPTVTELGNGVYAIAYTTTHTNTLGRLNLHITAAGADPVDTEDQVVAFDPQDATRLGLTALPNAAAGSVGGLQTPIVAAGTAQGGTATSITLQAGSSATTDIYKGNAVRIIGGTGAGQARVITGYNGGTLAAAVSRAWVVTPDATSVYTVVAEPHPALDSNLAVTAGTVSDKTGYSLSQAFPANFSLLSIDASGFIALKASEHQEIAADTKDGLNGAAPGGAVAGSVYDSLSSLLTKVGTPTGASLAADIANLPTASQGAAAVWAAATRTITGNVTVGGYASGQDPATLLKAMTVDGSLTWGQYNTIAANLALDGDRSWSAVTHTAVQVYYRRASGSLLPDRTKPMLTRTTVYDSTNVQVVTQTVSLSNLP